jgi:site-specific recombinase XerD
MSTTPNLPIVYAEPIEEPAAGLPAVPVQAESDRQLVAMWVARSESENTRANYQRQADRFLAHVRKPLALVTIGDVQGYLATLEELAPATRALAVASLKSLFSFAQEVGFLRFNIGKVLKTPRVKNKLAERIMAEPDTMRMIALEPNARNRVLLTVLYGGGLRISELCELRWRDLQANGDAGQATVYGKGGKTRVVLLSANTWRLLSALRGEAGPDAPVFQSRKGGGALDPSMVHRVVKAAAERAGLSAEVSAHWLRHAHASHSLDRGAPIHLVQATLGHASVATTGRYLHARPSESSARFLGV